MVLKFNEGKGAQLNKICTTEIQPNNYLFPMLEFANGKIVKKIIPTMWAFRYQHEQSYQTRTADKVTNFSVDVLLQTEQTIHETIPNLKNSQQIHTCTKRIKIQCQITESCKRLNPLFHYLVRWKIIQQLLNLVTELFLPVETGPQDAVREWTWFIVYQRLLNAF